MCRTRGLCWARTFRGHVAAPAMIPINSRRFNVCPLRRTILTASEVPEEGRPAKGRFTPPRRPGRRYDQEIIAHKDAERIRLWARTTCDYSHACIRDALAALPVESAVLDGESVLMRPDNKFDFERT